MIGRVLHYFPSLNQLQKNRLLHLKELFEWWNQRINLVSRKDMENFDDHHLLHSLAMAAFISFPDKSSVVDAGTGGGLPGIPLAILFPEVKFHLVDSISKKMTAVAEICTALGLTNVSHECNRIEKVKEKFDYVVSRAVAPLPDIVRWTKGKINHQKHLHPEPGIFYLKGGDIADELISLPLNHRVYHLKEKISGSYFETKLLVHLYK